MIESNITSPETNRREKAVAFIVARLSSSRLPEKQLRTIGDKTILQWIIDNLNQCSELDQMVIATAAEVTNIPLKDYAAANNIPCFWYEGGTNDVTTRLRKAAEQYNADICVLISGDCPLVYGPAIDMLVAEFRREPHAEVLTILPDKNNNPHALEGVLISRRSAWQQADDFADSPELKEHQFPLLWMKPEQFKHYNCRLNEELYTARHRFSVDTWADLEFMQSLHDKLTTSSKTFSLPEVLQLIKEDPVILTINQHVHQRKLIDDEYNVLFMIDAGGHFGFGHLMRSLELARQITERKGWPVTFATDDESALNFLRNAGQRTLKGAFSRPLRGNMTEDNSIQQLVKSADLLVLDIYDQRDAKKGWRASLNVKCPVVVIDNRRPWAHEADMIITPGVTASKESLRKISIANHLAGSEYLILRRAVSRLSSQKATKTLDLVVYLHDRSQQAHLKYFIEKYRLRAKILTAFCDELPQIIAASRLYVSGFGISFYEALSLGTLPICYPDSEPHRQDAVRFYKHYGLDPQIIESDQHISTLLLPLLTNKNLTVPQCVDGTLNIVNALSSLLKRWAR